jgi:hypothetical protein
MVEPVGLTFDADEFRALELAVLLQPVGVNEPQQVVVRLSDDRGEEGAFGVHGTTPVGRDAVRAS